MPELQMDVAVANRFISSLSKSLQALCHGCMEFDSGIEIVGYINVNIDSGSKVDYVLNEKVLKSTTNSMTFVSNSFLAKKESQKQIRDGACSPIPHLSAISYSSGAHHSSQYHRTASQVSSHAQVSGGSQKRPWTDDWRISPKRHRIQNPHMGMQPFSDPNSQSHPQSFPSSSHNYSDTSFKQPQGPASMSNPNSTLQLQINIKKEALESDNQTAADSEQSVFDQSADDQTHDSSHDAANKINIKCDPDVDQSDTGETADSNNAATNEKTDFKGTFLDPSSSSDMLPSDDRSRQQESDASLPLFDENSETDCREEQGLTDDASVTNVRTANYDESEAGMSGDNETACDAAVEYDHAAEEGSYSQSAYEDAGEGVSDAGRLEVIEIDDEDEDVQAMFGDTHLNARKEQDQTYSANRHLKLTFPRHFRTASQNSYAQVYNDRLPVHSHCDSIVDPTLSVESLRCSYCTAVLMDESYLRCHVSRFHGDKMPFSCTQCGRGYISARGLSHHLQSHKGKTFMCPVCDAKFTQKFTIKRHLRVVHRSAQCQTCFAILKVGPEFDQHVLYCGS